jgi:molybdenum cofactor cytidylyltransferase
MERPDIARIAVVLLAAGRGERFGGAKLAVDLSGQPVACHAAAMLAGLSFAHRIVVAGPHTPDLAAFGFQAVPLDPPGAPQSRSLAIGIAAAQALGADAVLVALADMPLVLRAHVEALVAAFDGDRIGSRADGVMMPPAIFGAVHFDELSGLSGDRGAGRLLSGAPCVELPPAAALDIDRPDDLDRARKLLGGCID